MYEHRKNNPTKKQLFAVNKAIANANKKANIVCLKLRGVRYDHCRTVTDKLFDAKLKLDIVWKDQKEQDIKAAFVKAGKLERLRVI